MTLYWTLYALMFGVIAVVVVVVTTLGADAPLYPDMPEKPLNPDEPFVPLMPEPE